MISIVDYGMGNLQSVQKALAKLGFEATLISTPEEVKAATKLIIPGVGAFGDAMKGLAERGLVPALREAAADGKPIMGICLGMQVFFESSEESPGVEGLGYFKGTVKRFIPNGHKIPHMGWNNLQICGKPRLLAGLGNEPFVYFVHSYFVAPTESDVAAATCEYGETFVAAVERGNLCGTQFHPEKSQDVGLGILANFARI
ncbi:MAG: imidazole glycerol phosphate synthase subunit HisH [Candidatus Sumerlaeaceae bacterium]|nr:imidazole glycerol phosphate synthase subunit HisH [Candidatus Sumerlaeaceae bacterium]